MIVVPSRRVVLGRAGPNNGTETMVDTSSDGGQPQGTGASSRAGAYGAQQQVSIHVLGQYVKDLSFENPNAPASLRPSETSPQLDVNVNVNAKPLSETDFEVELKLDAQAKRADDTLFVRSEER